MRAPKAWPMHWCPRHTPKMGTSPPSSVTTSRLTPPSSGRPGPGEMMIGVRCQRPDARYVDGVVSEHHRIGAQLSQCLHQVVGEGVVIVDQQDAGHEPPNVVAAGGYSRPDGRSSEGQAGSRRSVPQGPQPPGAPTAKGSTRPSTGRYTPPIPRSVRVSPRWMGPLILFLLIAGR